MDFRALEEILDHRQRSAIRAKDMSNNHFLITGEKSPSYILSYLSLTITLAEEKLPFRAAE